MSTLDESGKELEPSASEVGVPGDSEAPADEAPPPCEAQPPKWTCPKCEEPNKAHRETCNNCGFPRPGSAPAEPARPQQPVPDVVDQALEELLKAKESEPAPASNGVKEEKKAEKWTCPKCDEPNKPERDRCNNCGWVKRSSSVVSIGSDDSPEKPPPVPRTAPAASKPAESNTMPAESSKRSKSKSSSSSSSSKSSSSSSSSSSSAEKWTRADAGRGRGRRSPSNRRKRRSPSRRRRSPSRRGDKARPARRGSRSRSQSFRRPRKNVEDHPMFKRENLERERKEQQSKWDAFVRNEEREREARRDEEQHSRRDYDRDSKDERYKDDWKDKNWKDSNWKDDRNDRDNNDWKGRDWKQDKDNDWKAKSWKDKDWNDGKDDWKKSSWKDNDDWRGKDSEPPNMVPPSMAPPDGSPPMTPVSGIGGASQDDADWKGSRRWGEKDGSTWEDGDYKKRNWRDKQDDSSWKQAWSKKRSWGEEDAWDEKDWKKAKKDKKDLKKDGKRGKEEKKEKKEKKKKRNDMPDKIDGDNWEEPKETVGLSLIMDLAEGNGLKWEYPLWDESRRSFAGYLRSPFSKEENEQYFETIRDGTEWLQPTSAYGVMPRKTAWLVKPGCTCNYHYGPFEVEACEFPPWMIDLMREVMPKCGYHNEDDWPDSCNMNLYEDGGSAVGWHADDESLFQGKFQDIAIISVSFGATRKFELRYNWPDEGDESVIRIPINSGDIMTMEGMCQKHLQHRVPKEERVSSPRINLTWRWVRKHTPRCAACRNR